MKKKIAASLLAIAVLVPATARDSTCVAPFEAEGDFSAVSDIDAAVLAGLRRRGLRPANRCSDEVFARRVYLDLAGRIPEPSEVVAFNADTRAEKRALLVDALLAREELASFQAMRWCDVLRVKSEFPINLWPNAAQAYHAWVRDALRENLPLDRFARELLTASGSSYRSPPANFFRAVPSREPAALGQAVALTFLGARAERWTEARRTGFAAFFSRVAYKRTNEWKEEIVFTRPGTATVTAVLPDGETVAVPPDVDPRRVFADWLLRPGNAWFARNLANRTWASLFGRGVIHEPDDIRPDNPPSNPALLAALERALVASRYDLRRFLRMICVSSTYQQSSIPREAGPETDALFGRYPVRRLEAEVIADALRQVTGTGESYTSATPEPYTFIPEEVRAVDLADGSVTSPLLDLLGRPARDTGLFSERSDQPTEAQRLHLLNSSDLMQRIRQGLAEGTLLPRELRNDPREAVEQVYLRVLSRLPTKAELAALGRYARSTRNPARAASDLVWALLNSKEFLYRH